MLCSFTQSRYIRSKTARRRPRLSSMWAVLLVSGYLAPSAFGQQQSFWPTSTVASVPEVTDDNNPVTLGLRFYADVAGSVTAIRFYKGKDNTGTHVADLWSATGTKLAEARFAGETAAGWQQVNLPSLVSITAKTTYVVSYLAPKGAYADDQSYAWSSLSVSPLHTSNASPGVYAYGIGTTFPNSVWQSSNYYVDIVFVPATVGGSTSYSISGHVTGSAATLTLSGAASGTAKTDSSGNYTFAGLGSGSYVIAPSQSGEVFSPSVAAVSISGASKTAVNFVASAAPPAVPHSVTLNWTPSTSTNISGYRLYRALVSGGPYALLTSSLVPPGSYVDGSVQGGKTYYYVISSVDSKNLESAPSNEAVAIVPTP
jgi:Domain of unknown function (DUF4082)